MKVKSLLFVLALITSICHAQTKTIQTAKEDIFVRGDLYCGFDMSGTRNYSYYYDNNDIKKRHGQLTENANRSDVISDWHGKISRNGTYSGSATYKDGKLNGTVKGNYNIKATYKGLGNSETVYDTWSFNATFNNGVPTGKWNFTRKTNDTQNIVNKEDKDVSNSAFATFTNGKLTAFSTTWGTNITIDNEGKISGKSGKYTIDKGFALVFERTNGALSPLEKEQKDIVTLLKESKLSHSEVIDKGYTIKIIELDISGYQWFYDNITQTGRASFYFENDDTGRILPEDNDNKIPSYLSCNLTILKRIDKDNYASFEDCMKFCNENTWGYDYIVENNYITNGYNGKLYINTDVYNQITKALEPHIDSMYNNAINIMNKYEFTNTKEAIDSYKEASKIFAKIQTWKDSKNKIEVCETRIKEIIQVTNEESYKQAIELINTNKNNNTESGLNAYITAKSLLESIVGWNDPDIITSLTNDCNARIKEIQTEVNNNKYKIAEGIMTKYQNEESDEAIEAYKEAISIYNSLNSYKNSEQHKRDCENRISKIQQSIKQMESIKNVIENKLNAIVAETKDKKPGLVTFLFSSSNFYDIFSYNGCEISSENPDVSKSNILKEKITPICPLIGYEISKITHNEYDYIVTLIVNVKTNAKTNQYATYETSFITNSKGDMVLKDINFKDKKVIKNIWDEMDDNNNIIMEKSKECKNIVSAYSKYMKTADKTTEEKLGKIVENQEKILNTINGSNAKDLDNKVKALKDKSIENVLKEIQK